MTSGVARDQPLYCRYPIGQKARKGPKGSKRSKKSKGSNSKKVQKGPNRPKITNYHFIHSIILRKFDMKMFGLTSVWPIKATDTGICIDKQRRHFKSRKRPCLKRYDERQEHSQGVGPVHPSQLPSRLIRSQSWTDIPPSFGSIIPQALHCVSCCLFCTEILFWSAAP